VSRASYICRRLALIAPILLAGHFLAVNGYGQSGPVNPGGFHCSPAPCVLPPTEASEGGSFVIEPLIATNPLNPEELLVGSVDYNCLKPSYLGLHLSRDGGSTWTRVECMPIIIKKNSEWWPIYEPAVGFDRKGNAYAAGSYSPSEGSGGFVGVQKSPDGGRWGTPVVALRGPGQASPFETHLAVDIGAGSPWADSVYVSGVMWSDQGYKNQVNVSHSRDGGATWTQTAVEPVQIYPEKDDFTRLAVGSDGTVYITWLHCRGKLRSGGALCPTVHTMFSKSTDGGNTWSPAQQIATVGMPHHWQLPHTRYRERVYNYPVIAVDNSDGAHAGNLYVVMYNWTGTFLQVQVIRSTDGGAHWSKPVPVAPPSDTHDQFFPAISVSPTGLVGVSWLDRRNDPANHRYQAFAAISTDGGLTFPNTQLTKAFSNPDHGALYWMGDYTGNTWAGGNFIAAWMDSSNGVDMQEVVGGIRLK